MNPRVPLFLAAALAAGAAPAQQPASAPPPASPPQASAPPAGPPPPAFAAPDLTEKGARALAANCSICHGTSGRAPSGSNVRGLAGRPKAELLQLMGAYRSGARPATVMHQIVKAYGDEELDAMAEWFSRQPREGGTP